MRDVLRAGVVAAATVAGLELLTLGDDWAWYVPLIVAALLCAAAGAIANRAWAMLVPFLCALVWSIVAAATYDPGDQGEMGLDGAVIIVFLLAAGAGACVFAGAALRRATERLAGRRDVSGARGRS